MLDLGPGLALSLHEQRKDSDFTANPNAVLVENLVIGEKADRLGADLAPHARFFEGLASGRFRRSQAFYRPALWDDPALRLSRGDEENFEFRVTRKPIGQRARLRGPRASPPDCVAR